LPKIQYDVSILETAAGVKQESVDSRVASFKKINDDFWKKSSLNKKHEIL